MRHVESIPSIPESWASPILVILLLLLAPIPPKMTTWRSQL
jgi:hypothetical protein